MSSSNIRFLRKTLREQGFTIVGGKKEPLVNSFIIRTNKFSTKELVLLVLVWAICWTVLLACMLDYLGCLDFNYYDMHQYLSITSLLINGSGPELRDINYCYTTSILSRVLSFITDTFVFTVFVTKITSPKAELEISDCILLKQRNGKLLLQFRVHSVFGHCIDNITIHACYYHSVTSIEGEQYMEITPVKFVTSFVAIAPLNCNHIIDEHSPFFGLDFASFDGSIEVTVIGYDTVLDTRVSRTIDYSREHVKIGYDWKSMFMTKVEDFLKAPKVATLKLNALLLSEVSPVSETVQDMIKKTIASNHFDMQNGNTCSVALQEIVKSTRQRSLSLSASQNQLVSSESIDHAYNNNLSPAMSSLTATPMKSQERDGRSVMTASSTSQRPKSFSLAGLFHHKKK
jgi:hypothetical protein